MPADIFVTVLFYTKHFRRHLSFENIQGTKEYSRKTSRCGDQSPNFVSLGPPIYYFLIGWLGWGVCLANGVLGQYGKGCPLGAEITIQVHSLSSK